MFYKLCSTREQRHRARVCGGGGDGAVDNCLRSSCVPYNSNNTKHGQHPSRGYCRNNRRASAARVCGAGELDAPAQQTAVCAWAPSHSYPVDGRRRGGVAAVCAQPDKLPVSSTLSSGRGLRRRASAATAAAGGALPPCCALPTYALARQAAFHATTQNIHTHHGNKSHLSMRQRVEGRPELLAHLSTFFEAADTCLSHSMRHKVIKHLCPLPRSVRHQRASVGGGRVGDAHSFRRVVGVTAGP